MIERPTKSERSRTSPFVKWAGGKRWLANELAAMAPPTFKRYFEPFLGGGAAFFHLRPWPATLSDRNPELINAYIQVRDHVDELIDRLSGMEIDEQFFLKTRQSRPRKPITSAVRFLYLNRTAFNGLYRVNRNGDFNVPFGCKPGTKLCDEALLRSASIALQNRTLRVCDFQEAIDSASEGDFVYADPPYTVKHNNNGFRRYNEVIFSWEDQERLAKACTEAVARGVHVIVSNAQHVHVLDLYPGFNKKSISRDSLISGTLAGRGVTSEVLISSTSLDT